VCVITLALFPYLGTLMLSGGLLPDTHQQKPEHVVFTTAAAGFGKVMTIWAVVILFGA